ncbi:MAG: hypothetical protein WD749_14045 [Phycisphaerales bacterium]
MRPVLFLRALAAASAALAAPALAAPPVPAGQPLVTVKASGIPARDAIAWLGRAAGLRLVPLWRDAEHPEGLDPDRALDLTLTRADPMHALEVVLRQLDGDATWQLDESGAVEIGPRARLNESRSVRIYNIRDLLTRAPDHPQGATLDLEAALRAGSESVLREDDRGHRPDADLERAERAERLVLLITSTVEPDQWVDNGGAAATIRVHEGSLVVRAPGYIHRQIAGSLLPRATPTTPAR